MTLVLVPPGNFTFTHLPSDALTTLSWAPSRTLLGPVLLPLSVIGGTSLVGAYGGGKIRRLVNEVVSRAYGTAHTRPDWWARSTTLILACRECPSSPLFSLGVFSCAGV